MYGSDTSQAATLAVTGSALGVAGHLLAAAVIVLAGLALLTTAKVVRSRRGQR